MIYASLFKHNFAIDGSGPAIFPPMIVGYHKAFLLIFLSDFVSVNISTSDFAKDDISDFIIGCLFKAESLAALNDRCHRVSKACHIAIALFFEFPLKDCVFIDRHLEPPSGIEPGRIHANGFADRRLDHLGFQGHYSISVKCRFSSSSSPAKVDTDTRPSSIAFHTQSSRALSSIKKS